MVPKVPTSFSNLCWLRAKRAKRRDAMKFSDHPCVAFMFRIATTGKALVHTDIPSR